MKQTMLKSISIFFVFISLSQAIYANLKDGPEGITCINQVESTLPDRGIFQFQEKDVFIQKPVGYTPDGKYPTILYFHGRGGSAGTVMKADYTMLVDKARDRGYIFIAPSCGQDSWMGPETEKFTLELLDFLEKHLSQDSDRFYVMGGSMGGGATLTFASRYPEKVTAACDIFGISDFFRFYKERSCYQKSIAKAYGGTPQQCPEVYRQRSAVYNIDQFKKVPLLIIHGDKDKIVYVSHSKTLYQKLKSADAKVELVIVPNMGHSAKILSGNEDRILDFFEAHTRTGE